MGRSNINRNRAIMLNKNIKKMGFGGTYKLCKNKRKNIDSNAEQRQTFALDRFGGIRI